MEQCGSPLLILHILAGSIGLLTGTVAMAVRKGGNLHRASGNVFTVAMLTLATSAFCLAILKSQEGNIVGSVGTFYLIGTSEARHAEVLPWLAARNADHACRPDQCRPARIRNGISGHGRISGVKALNY